LNSAYRCVYKNIIAGIAHTKLSFPKEASIAKKTKSQEYIFSGSLFYTDSAIKKNAREKNVVACVSAGIRRHHIAV
jgi:hypothetical protein